MRPGIPRATFRPTHRNPPPYGVAGLVGPRIAAYFKDAGTGLDAWRTPFVVAGVACLVAAALALVLRPPTTKPLARPRAGALAHPV